MVGPRLSQVGLVEAQWPLVLRTVTDRFWLSAKRFPHNGGLRETCLTRGQNSDAPFAHWLSAKRFPHNSQDMSVLVSATNKEEDAILSAGGYTKETVRLLT